MNDRHGHALRVAVMASGSGTNLQAILDAIAAGKLVVDPVLVLSDNPAARALERGQEARIQSTALPPANFESQDAWMRALREALDAADTGLVVLAGFMRILGPELVGAYTGRMLNIHPSLLPRYRGLNTYRRVLESGATEHGTSVHFVTEELDGGPVIARARIAIGHDDDEQTLRDRVQRAEHTLYPEVIRWFAEGRLKMRDDAAWLDGGRLARPLDFLETDPLFTGEVQARGKVTPR